MKIQYEATIGEAADVEMRHFGKRQSLWQWQSKGLLYGALLCVFFYCVLPYDHDRKLPAAAVGGITFAVIYIGTYRKRIRKRIEKILSAKMDSDQPFSVEYEFNEEALIVRRMGNEIRFAWDNVKEINEADKDVEFVIDGGGLTVLPYRAFANAEERQEWLDFAKNKTG